MQGDDGRLRAALPAGSGDKFDQWFGYRLEVRSRFRLSFVC
jgi:hypothetical protein